MPIANQINKVDGVIDPFLRVETDKKHQNEFNDVGTVSQLLRNVEDF